jgi:hypothetical protein
MMWLVVVLAGGLGLTLCDQLHVHAGVLAYPRSDLRIAGQSWWVAPLFLLVAVLVMAAAATVVRARPRSGSWAHVARASAWFVGAYAATATFEHHPRVLAIVLTLVWIDRVALRSDRWQLIGFSVALAVAGTLGEGTLAASGAFAYRYHDIYHVPMWLPTLYLHGALLAVAVARVLVVKEDAREARSVATSEPG